MVLGEDASHIPAAPLSYSHPQIQGDLAGPMPHSHSPRKVMVPAPKLVSVSSKSNLTLRVCAGHFWCPAASIEKGAGEFLL